MEMETLRLSSHKTNTKQLSHFNSETSHNECTAQQEGLISKTRVLKGAAAKAKELDIQGFPLQLITLLIGINWCGMRLEKWPDAPDARSAQALCGEFDKVVEKYGTGKVFQAVDIVAERIQESDWSIIQSRIDFHKEKAEKEERSKFSNSPLFQKFQSIYPYISAESFDSVYNNSGKSFIYAATTLLRRSFSDHKPDDLPPIQGWEQRWQQHLPRYLNRWQEELSALENQMRPQQQMWQESIS